MHIGLFGHGKMGKATELLARARGHNVTILPTRNLPSDWTPGDIECIIDFTEAGVARKSLPVFIRAGIPVVSGTTGLGSSLDEIRALCMQLKGAFLHAPNFSPGMHIMFHMNRELARIMNHFPEYKVSLLEKHHSEKRDAPSGTALTLADQVIEALDRVNSWAFEPGTEDEMRITATREGDLKGTHRVSYECPADIISIRHHAVSRDGFASGAVMAAEWLAGRTGNYSFADVMSDVTKE